MLNFTGYSPDLVFGFQWPISKGRGTEGVWERTGRGVEEGKRNCSLPI